MGCCFASSASSNQTPLLDDDSDAKQPDYYIKALPNKGMSILGCCPCTKSTLVKAVVSARTRPERMEVAANPGSVGIPFEDVDIHSTDGIRLSAWLMLKPSSDKLVIFNHPLLCNRYGSVKGFEGVSVEFLPMYKNLFDAGYSILTYDQRAQGQSDGGSEKTLIGSTECVAGVGAVEWQDFLGVLKYVDEDERVNKCKIAIYSQCMGAGAVFGAWSKSPEAFDLGRIKCQFANQPVISYNMVARITQKNFCVNVAKEIDDAMFEQVGFRGVDPVPMMRVSRLYLCTCRGTF